MAVVREGVDEARSDDATVWALFRRNMVGGRVGETSEVYNPLMPTL